MANDTQDPFGSIPIADDEQEEGTGEQPPPLDSAPAERPSDGEPAEKTASPLPPRRSRRKRQRRGSDRWRRRLAWLAAIPAAGLVLYLLAGYLAVPYLLESVLPGRLARTLERPVTVGDASFNPFTLTVTLTNGIIGPRLADPAEGIDPLLSFGRLELDLAAAGLLRRGLIGDKVTIHRLIVHLVRREDGTYNLQELLPPSPGRLGFSLNNISLRDSRLLFDDRPAGATHTVEEIDLALPSLGNLDYRPERFLSPRFAAKVNGSPLRLTGETTTTAEGSEARLTLRLEELDLPRYFAYLPLEADFNVSKGRAELDLDLLIRTGRETDTRLQIEGTGRLSDVWLQSKTGKELARLPVAKGVISFAPLGGLYRLKELVLQQPELLLERDPEGRWLLPRLTAASGARVEIDRLRVTGGKLAYVDRRVEGGFADTWSDLHLTIEDLADDSGNKATFALSGRNKDRTRLSAQGRIEHEPLRAEGIVVGHDVQLAAFNPYLSTTRRLRLGKNGVVPKAEGQFSVRAGENGELKFSLRKLAARIEGLALARQHEEWARLPEIVIQDTAMDWPERRLVLGKLEGSGGSLLLDWDAEGRLNWSPSGEEAVPWQVAVKAAGLKKTDIRLRTLALAEPLTLEFREAAVTLTDLTTREGTEGRLEVSARLFGETPVELAGPLSAVPFGARLTGRVEDLSLMRLEPLFSGWFRPAIRQGTLQANGELRLPDGVFRGGARIEDFTAGVEGKDLLRCGRMTAPELAVDFRTGALRAVAVTLHRPYAAWALDGQGGSSLEGLFNIAWTSAEGTPRLALDRIDIEEGELAFSDPAASPPYAAALTAASGSLAPLASTPASRSRFELTGRIGGAARLAVQGELKPFAGEAAAEAEGEIRGLPIASLSPYLSDQLGYRLAGGTLDLAASLRFAASRLRATNRLDIAGLALGEPVSRSSRLPLTVALLTDRSGTIELDIPVEGDTGSPDFSYREELRNSIRHLLLRTTVSPFSFLADAAPDTNLREYLAFPAGGSELTAEIEEEIQALARVLAERPRLKLVLKGFAGDGDRQAIKARKEAEQEARRRVREAQQTGKLAAAYGEEENRILVPPIAPDPPPLRIKVTDELLLELASGRSENIQRYLLGVGIPETRVAVAPAGGPVAADAPGRPASRVEIGLEAL